MLGSLLRRGIIIILAMTSAFAADLLHKHKPVLCVGENSSISQLQGQGKRSPFVNKRSERAYRSDKVFTVQGVVTKLKSGRNAGFFMQQTTATTLSLASTGIFVSTAEIANIKRDSSVCVTGFVEEYYGMTRLQVTADITILDSTVDSAVRVQPTNIMVATADANFSDTLERYEGMQVRLVNITDMRVTKPLYYDRRWQNYTMILSHQQINIHPNTMAFPGSIHADQQALENKQRRLYLQLAAGRSLTSDLDYMRVNDRVSGIVGVLDFSYGEFRLLADNALAQTQFQHRRDRQSLAPRTGAHLRIASFNLLNYFNRAAGGDNNPLRQNRGATTLSALRNQEIQLRDTIVALDADFIGLMEMENNGFGQNSAIRRLLDLVNQAIQDPSKHYVMVKPRKSDLHQGRYLGTGAITVAGFYRPTQLKLVNTRVIQLPIQRSMLGNAYHRPALTPTFIRVSDNHRQSKRLTISVNHFKSKGSKCAEDKQRAAMLKKLKRKRNKSQQSLRAWQQAKRTLAQDRQGHCAQFRTTAASVLAQALASESGSKIILGDLNSYPKEDPLLVLTDYDLARYAYYKIVHSGYNYLGKTLLNAKTNIGFGYHDPFVNQPETGWTYSFKALGRLDYILLSPDLLSSLVTQKIWHINAAESYVVNNSRQSNRNQEINNSRVGVGVGDAVGAMRNMASVFSSSDHEPLFIELK
ncbi:ExeM/NucH family extracellular endonuclease [Moritella yayanosii]|uniref:Extracellular nuclease-related protein n=1 Tax=Moritella yayanosii TaxID=69539 RepID=A0A330LUF7_9GAMM|nr:ExeM/NucH family extracellular endonuclease [Moritella yayanosii]SQD77615.1 Extracellular nuclease-related protein [Moritella yayanosii]